MHKLTKVDRILITELMNNSRTPINEISKKHKISRTAVSKRLKILEEKEILGEYNIDFNPSLIGVFGVDILIKTKRIPDISIIKELTKKIEPISRCVLCSGPYNVQLRCYLNKIEDIQKSISEISSILEFQNINYLIPIERTFFLRDFFNLGLRINKIQGPFYHGLTINRKCNKTDIIVLDNLIQNSRQSISEIAKKIKKPVSTVNFSFKKLKNQGVIEKFGSFLRAANFGYDIDQIKLNIKRESESINKRILDFCSSSKNIFVYNRSFGKFNHNLMLFVNSNKETYSIAKKLQEKMPEIDSIDIFRIYEGYSQPLNLVKLVG
jgi:DNA-binding Lrp family transcriptional regulator